MDARVTAIMKELGFTANAARAYVALLKTHPATGYELAATSGVPRSAIYTVLKGLESRGVINAIHGKPARYVPLPPTRLVDLLSSRFSRNAESLKDALDEIAGQEEGAATWTIRGYDAMLDQARSLIASAEDSVYASLWSREATALEEPLKTALADGVKVALFSFTNLPSDLGTQLSYGIDEAALEAYWSHGIILIVDGQHALIGGAETNDMNRAVVTGESALVEMARSNLVLDVTLYGQRTGVDTAAAIAHITRHLAPVDDLIAEAVAARAQA